MNMYELNKMKLLHTYTSKPYSVEEKRIKILITQQKIK